MTYSSSGSERVMAPDADPPPPVSSSSNSSSSSSSSTSSHSRSHIHSDSHSPHVRSTHGNHHAHVHRYDSVEEVTSEHIEPQDQTKDQDITQRDIDSSDRADHSNQDRSQDSEAESNPIVQVRDDSGYITHVVQTVSLVQVVDSTGSPIAVQTHYATPNTIVVDSASGSTVSVSNPESSDHAQNSADMTSVNASTPGVAVTSSADSNGYLVPSQNSASNVATPAASTYSIYGSQDAISTPGTHNATTSATTDLSSSVTSQTTLTDTTYSTSVPTTSSSTVDSSMRVEMISTPTSTTRSFTSSSISSSTTLSTTSSTSTTSTLEPSSTTLSSTIYTYSTEVWTSTQYVDDGSSGGGDYGSGATAAAQPANPTTTSESSGSSGSTLSKQQKQIVGGVVGSIAGVAFLALLILLAIKHKKRHGRHALLGEGPDTRSRGLITGGDGDGSGGAMAERSAPFAVAAALAGLSSKRSTQVSEPAPTAERGFYRVSGKKLPSVLHNGGDGYTDPREANRDSVASGHTDYWRGSQAFFPSSDGGSTKLALGSPMRPVSGVPIIRTGPARTPVTEENPFSDPAPRPRPDPSTRPRPDSDALGDSVCAGSRSSQDGSWNSPSRFQERI